MPKASIENYASYVDKFLKNRGQILLQSYSGYDLDTTIHPETISSFFKGRDFNLIRKDRIFSSSNNDYYFVSKNHKNP